MKEMAQARVAKEERKTEAPEEARLEKLRAKGITETKKPTQRRTETGCKTPAQKGPQEGTHERTEGSATPAQSKPVPVAVGVAVDPKEGATHEFTTSTYIGL